MSASSLIQYNRARTSNFENLTIPIGVFPPVLLLEMGIFNPTAGSNFLEIVSSIGWVTISSVAPIIFEVIVDGTIVGMTDEQLSGTTPDTHTTFQTILDNVSQGHHVIQLTARAGFPGFYTVNGPLTMTASVYA